MKKIDLSEKQLEEIEKFGTNTWFVEYLYSQFKDDPNQVSEQWKEYFDSGNLSENKAKKDNSQKISNKRINYPQPGIDDEIQIIAGSSARILENMTDSLTIPTATSQRVIPVKLLEENRTIINNHLQKINAGKVSFTHIIAWAMVKALVQVPAMNNIYSIKDDKSIIIKRKNVNLGLAIDIEKKDGTRSLIVPNIKDADSLNFKTFFQKYEDLVKRSRKGQIDPSEFLGTTITLTNPGTLGTFSSIPRLMIGQGAIIASGAIQYPAEYQAVAQETISTLGISKIMNITSTYDHRVIQGAESGLFLSEINKLLVGEHDFYKQIFEDLKIPANPLTWQNDYQPGIFNNNVNTEEIEKQARVLQLINLYRVRGHLVADIDPLGSQGSYHPELDPSSFKFTVWDLDRQFITGGFSGIKQATLRQILDTLQKTYCNKIGVEYMHIQNPEEKIWLQQMMEPVRNTPQFTHEQKKHILTKLLVSELFEHFIHNKFVGHKRFSLEGSETLIPALDMILNEAQEKGINEAVLGMSHRGRLNVLANIIGKSYEIIFSEFEDIQDTSSVSGSGDVKYHLGYSGQYKTKNNKTIAVSVASNPSHLEWVNPVVEGMVRAKQTMMNDKVEHRKVIPILIHGDAAFAGQGVVAETLNLSQLSGYRVGGTIHIIVNNQIGFTTTPEDARSSVYATDVAKMIQIPIFHVNGDHPEYALWVAKMAFEYRQRFKKDVVIDLLGYRKYGHNEGDEPGFTQPILYDKIKAHNSVRKLYADCLLKENVLTKEEYEELEKNVNFTLNSAFEKIKTRNYLDEDIFEKQNIVSEMDHPTSISEEQLNLIVKGITTYPEKFNTHPKLLKFLEKRKSILEDGSADWALGEAIAFGGLLLENIPVRLSGQDSVRGTFSQRHIALTDINTGKEYVGLNYLADEQAKIEALDSFLSEAAVLGFEYGYSTIDLKTLVMWEAQFGDFANGAQIIIDNFIVASKEKWKLPNKVVLLLPHGYEGQGPEHSSARLERFLTLSAQNNIQVCYPTTPAQYFHLLRRQAKNIVDKPLVIMTPKSLLRLPEAKSYKHEFLSGSFMDIIDDKIEDKKSINKIVLISGKIFYELDKFRKENNVNNIAIIRLEQLYPLNKNDLKNLLLQYENVEDLLWVQEEPMNMGAWNYISSRVFEEMEIFMKIRYVGRKESASPSVGSYKKSMEQLDEIMKEVFK